MGSKDKVRCLGSGWSQLHTTPGFQAISSGKVSCYYVSLLILARGLTDLTCKGEDKEV